MKSSQLNFLLLKSVLNSDFDNVKLCLQNGASSDTACLPNYISVCHLAAFLNAPSILEQLILNRADPYIYFDKDGRSALHLAAWQGNTDCVAVLLKYVTNKKNIGFEPMDSLASRPLNDYINYLAVKQNVHRVTEEDLCCALGVHQLLKETIDKISDIWCGYTAIDLASARAHSVTLDLLLKSCKLHIHLSSAANTLDICGAAYENDLASISQDGFLKTLQVLSKYSVAPQSRALSAVDSSTCLHIAVLTDNESAIRHLLLLNYPTDVFNSSGDTPIHLAVKNKKEIALRCMWMNSENFDVEIRNGLNETPLMMAISGQWLQGVEFYLQLKASLFSKCCRGETAMHHLALIDNEELVNMMLSYSSNVKVLEEKNNSGRTPLMLAIVAGNESFVSLISKKISFRFHRNFERNSPVHLAVIFSQLGILKFMIKNETSKEVLDVMVNGRDDEGKTSLHYAVGDAECVRILVEAGADVTMRDNRGYTPLHEAVKRNTTSLLALKILIDQDETTMNIRDKDNCTPFHLAIFNKNREFVKLFLKKGANVTEMISDPNELSSKYRPAVEHILKSFPKPVDIFLELFDSQILCQTSEDFDKIQLDYSTLLHPFPETCILGEPKVPFTNKIPVYLDYFRFQMRTGLSIDSTESLNRISNAHNALMNIEMQSLVEGTLIDADSHLLNEESETTGTEIQLANAENQLAVVGRSENVEGFLAKGESQPMNLENENARSKATNAESLFVKIDNPFSNVQIQSKNDESLSRNSEIPLSNSESVLMNNEGQLAKDDGRLTKDESQLINNECELTEDDGRLTKNRSQFINNEGRFTKGDGPLTKDRGQLTNDEGQLIEGDGRLTKDRSQFINNEGQLTKEDGPLTKDRSQLMNDESRLATANSSLLNIDADQICHHEMNVLHVLMTCSSYDQQQKLLLHPYVESFLRLKWTKLKYLFAATLLLNNIKAIMFTALVVCLYTKGTPEEWIVALKSLIGLSVVQHVILTVLNAKGDQSHGPYYPRVEEFQWSHWRSVMTLSSQILSILTISLSRDWTVLRIICSVNILMEWFMVTCSLADIPSLSYFFQMFRVVTMRVITVLVTFGLTLTFAFGTLLWIIIGGTEFPFNDPISSIFKSVIMMTSEFDYNTIFDRETWPVSLLSAQIAFLAFVIMVPIVMMNLLLALAINDTNDLIEQGRAQRLREQVKILNSLESIYLRFWPRIAGRMCVGKRVIVKRYDKRSSLSKRIVRSLFLCAETNQCQE